MNFGNLLFQKPNNIRKQVRNIETHETKLIQATMAVVFKNTCINGSIQLTFSFNRGKHYKLRFHQAFVQRKCATITILMKSQLIMFTSIEGKTKLTTASVIYSIYSNEDRMLGIVSYIGGSTATFCRRISSGATINHIGILHKSLAIQWLSGGGLVIQWS